MSEAAPFTFKLLTASRVSFIQPQSEIHKFAVKPDVLQFDFSCISKIEAASKIVESTQGEVNTNVSLTMLIERL